MARFYSFLFLGPEIGEKNEAVEARRRLLQKEAGCEPEIHSFYVGDKPFPEIVSVLLNGSLFSPARLILLKNAELIKKKSEIEALASFWKSPPDGTMLILISDSTKVDAGVEKLFKKDEKKIFWEMFEADKERWVCNFFEKEGFRIEGGAVQAILGMTENDTMSLRNVCSGIVLFRRAGSRGAEGKQSDTGGAGGRGAAVISEEEIITLLSNSKEENAFMLFSAIASGEVQRGFEILHGILSAGTAPAPVFALLASCYRKFRDYCLLSAAGGINDFELKKIGINALSKKDYTKAQRIYGNCADSFLALNAEYDMLTRSNYALADIIMDLYLSKIFSRRRTH